jgi:hypothetical protein
MVRRVSSGRFFQRGRAGVSKVGLDWCVHPVVAVSAWPANHSVHAHPACSDLGFIAIPRFTHHSEIRFLFTPMWAKCVCALANFLAC